MTDLLVNIEYFTRYFFDHGSTGFRWLQNLADFIISDPLIMAVAAFFFVGIVVAFFMRVYHSIL